MCKKMSDVRLSNASPPLERVDARQQDRLRPRVCRNLFGKPDEVHANLTATLEDDTRRLVDHYNFDPDQGPLPGGEFQWTVERDAPEFYSRPPHRRRGPLAEDSRDSARGQNRDSSKKRASDAAGLSSECTTKRLHSGEDDDYEPPTGAGGRTGEVQ
ncbi:cyclin-dependent kinase inhibitor 1Ba isoform X1 [Syngnathus typhle]|uniref:cyclin-dependent kinase inhibitor 1Ba isoform X1 n=2 Tax=Syngnathus typhle TaxID=161592 RepID=UPI002A69FFFA|nr:cyclin-dependent kinase inhibitor 1Ba isoform X1 [Syngnathus typhle]